ncbi:substrate-binding periplasmic protein [Halopseudomonas salina]|uniref:Solute-binding protein family 3/N-terminal domain-containing protein n=1 Tax=Halopseudomonas salina TaxID=1323744 RepID=A0ABQ1NVH9_9GAMM|nr:transporter substrate-binding domain-containing protein [Halopseudomonas salina]GGC85616.1 hypothetical protein GCM10007418_01710 [Halopseudomonas salina]
MFSPRLLLLSLLITSCSAVGAPVTQPPATPTFLIAEVWPWGYFDKDNQPAGIIKRFASRLSEQAGIEMNYRVLPHQRVLADFSRSDGDYTMLFQNPEVDSFAERVAMVQVSDIMLMTHRESRLNLTLGALAGKTLGYIGGTYYGEDFHADQRIVKLPVSSLDQALRMLQLGRLDALITSDILLHHSLRQAQLDPGIFRAQVLTRGHEAYLYVSHGSRTAAHVPLVRAALEEMRANGELDEMFRNSLQLPPNSSH